MPTSTRTRRSPLLLHPPFVSAAAALLIAAFVTDLFYYQTSIMQWANFSVWLITGGLAVALVAAIVLLVDFLLGHTGRIHRIEFSGLVIVALLSIVNAFVHSRDAYTAVVPDGLELSALVTLILLVLGWRGWSLRAVRPSHSSKPREARS